MRSNEDHCILGSLMTGEDERKRHVPFWCAVPGHDPRGGDDYCGV